MPAYMGHGVNDPETFFVILPFIAKSTEDPKFSEKRPKSQNTRNLRGTSREPPATRIFDDLFDIFWMIFENFQIFQKEGAKY